jgi:hypothetical protein
MHSVVSRPIFLVWLYEKLKINHKSDQNSIKNINFIVSHLNPVGDFDDFAIFERELKIYHNIVLVTQ